MFAIFDILKSIGEAIATVFDFIVKFFSDLVYVIEITGSVVAQIPALFSWLPTELVTLLVVGFGIVVIYKILGREG